MVGCGRRRPPVVPVSRWNAAATLLKGAATFYAEDPDGNEVEVIALAAP